MNLEQNGTYIVKNNLILSGDSVSKIRVLEVTDKTYHLTNLDSNHTFRITKKEFSSKYVIVETIETGEQFNKRMLDMLYNQRLLIKTDSECSNFKKDLEHIINVYSKDNEAKTPDFVLAEYLDDCLTAYIKANEKYNFKNFSKKSHSSL